jgi:DNA-binding response OmpR family regulator
MARILVIDDSWLIRQSVTNYLKRAKYEVILAESGNAGLDLCLKENPDLVLLDLLMPDLSGLDVLQKLRSQGVKTPIIILTADIQITTQEKCRASGASDFMLKPPNEEHLIYKITKFLQSEKV